MCLEFFDGIEDNIAFSYTINENQELVPIKKCHYHLFNSNIYPFVIYEEELGSLNQYCYEITQIVKSRFHQAVREVAEYKNTDGRLTANKNFTNYEMLLGSQHNMYLWQEIAWHSACHLTVLLYSFLERALKKLYYDLFKETTATLHLPKGTAKIYIYLAHIFQLHIHEWRQQEPNIYHLLELARKVRNGFVHGNFQKNSVDRRSPHSFFYTLRTS